MIESIFVGIGRFAAGTLLNLPAALVVFAIVALTLRLRIAGRMATRLRITPLHFALIVSVLAAAAQGLGYALIATGHERIGVALTSYPGSLVFYLLPDQYWEDVPEGALFFLGTLSSTFVAAVATSFLLALILAVRARRPGAPSAAAA